MIYEYAVDPSFFNSEGNACFILENFGRDHGRLISEIKKDHWISLVRDTIRNSNNKPIARQTLKEALKILVKNKRALYCRQRRVEDSNWRTLTEKEHKKWPFRGILVEQYEGTNDHFLIRDINLSNKEKWLAPSSVTVEREPQEMVNAVSPMLENSREVMLVDRNFRLENSSGSFIGKYKNVLMCFLKFLANKQYGPSVNKLFYHLGINGIEEISNPAIRNMENSCIRHLKNDIPSGIKLEIAIWPWNQLHDRFLLTELGGIDFGIGLDEFTGSNERTVRLKRISKDDHAQEWSKFKNKQPDIILP
jgi:hypothetical protein